MSESGVIEKLVQDMHGYNKVEVGLDQGWFLVFSGGRVDR